MASRTRERVDKGRKKNGRIEQGIREEHKLTQEHKHKNINLHKNINTRT